MQNKINKITNKDYTIIANEFLRDKELSWQAKGLLAYILSLPSNWVLYVKDLKNRSKNGEDSTRNCINELINNEYMYREKMRNKENGKFSGYEYYASGEKALLKGKKYHPTTENPHVENPNVDNPYLANHQLLSINNTNNTINNNNTYVLLYGNKIPLKNLQIKYNNILRKTLIKIGGFKTRIDNDTKTMRNVYKYLYELEHKKFLPNKTIKSPILKDVNLNRIDTEMSERHLTAILTRAAKNWKKALNDKDIFTPEKAPSMDAWFYTPPPHNKHGMSWFLYCAGNCMKQTGEVVVQKQLENTKKWIAAMKLDPQEISNQIYDPKDIKNWSITEQLQYFTTIKKIIVWRAENKEELREREEGWLTHFYSYLQTFKTIGLFLEETFPNKPYPKFLVPGSPIWDKFKYYIKNCYGVKL